MKTIKNIIGWVALIILTPILVPAMWIHTAYKVWYFRNIVLKHSFKPVEQLD